MNVLDLPLLRQTRRNHALEHATIHVLNGRIPRLRIAGRSQANGFYLYGDLKTEDIASAVEEARQRMVAGERHLAVHPGCGTNMVTAGVLAGSISFILTLMTGRHTRWYERLPNATLGGLAGVFLAKPAGPWLQANVTTSADMTGMHVRSIRRQQTGRMVTHFVETTSP